MTVQDGATLLAVLSAALWASVLLAPWQAWSTRERLTGPGRRGVDAPPAEGGRDVTILIPARNEGATLTRTLDAALAQDAEVEIRVVDDESTDDTAAIAEAYAGRGVRLIRGEPRPAGWSGKLWALEQGRRQVERPLTLLLDADIELGPGALRALLAERHRRGAALVSVMAALRMESRWERWLMPAFVYFFKLLYPFRLSNAARPRWIAAAAGGCVLLETRLFREAGLFASMRHALIDDCTLARRVKATGARTWIGVTRQVVSHRGYDGLGPIWRMVARTAYTQLGRSVVWLSVCTLLMVLAFVVPVATALAADGTARIAGAVAWSLLAATYVPTLRYYRRSLWAAPLLPAVGVLYLAMTWDSARAHWLGRTAAWRGRVYPAGEKP